MRLKKTAMPTDPADLATWVVVEALAGVFILKFFKKIRSIVFVDTDVLDWLHRGLAALLLQPLCHFHSALLR